jgi:hypothetical protein
VRLLVVLAALALPAAAAHAASTDPNYPGIASVTATVQSKTDIALSVTTPNQGQIGCSGFVGHGKYGTGVAVNPIPAGTMGLVIHASPRTKRTLRRRSLSVDINCRYSLVGADEATTAVASVKVPRSR